MKFKTTLCLIGLAVVLALVVVWLDGRQRQEQARKRLGARALDFREASVTTLRLTRGDLRATFARSGEEWTLTSPVAGIANRGRIARLLSVLATLSVLERIEQDETARRGLTAASFGLEPPSATIEIEAPGHRWHLTLGMMEPLGSGLFVAASGTTDILVVPSAILDAIPPSLDEWRDRRLLHAEPRRIERLEVESPNGFVQLVKGAAGWEVRQPIFDLADADRVQAIVERLCAIRIDGFEWDAPPGETTIPMETYGLAPGSTPLIVRVWEIGDDVGDEIWVGKAAGENLAYARTRRFPSIYRVPTQPFPLLDVPVDELRDRRIIRTPIDNVRALTVERDNRGFRLVRDPIEGWLMSEPIRWKADEQMVEALLCSLSERSVVRYEPLNSGGFDEQPFVEGTVRLIVECSEGKQETLQLGWQNGEQGAWRRIHRTDWRVTGVIPARVTAALDSVSRMPSSLRNRIMLALPRDEIRSFSIREGDLTERIVLEPNGVWRRDSEGGAPVDSERMEDALFLVAMLRAERIVEDTAGASPGDYGLTRPSEAVTIGLSGVAGIQKIILFGNRAPSGHRYAMVAGDGVIFELSEDAYRAFMTLARPGAPSPEANTHALQ